ncbi:MAG: MATE family efflux transporter [Tannerellaceae bacterium]|nr:MATE family efflux transporter [Tannerellaceae bacterium]
MNKEILRLAIPNIITNITVPILGMVDTSIAGHLDSELYIAAIALAAMIFNFIYWNFGFLRMGTSGFTAQAFGAGNRQEIMNILVRSLAVAFVLGIVFIILQKLILTVAFHFVTVTPETRLYVSQYFSIYIWAAPAVLGMYTITGWFIGMQDSRTPMFISITTNLVNIALSLLFVFVFGMQIQGVALGSALAQGIALLLSLFFWFHKHGALRTYFTVQVLKDITGFKPFFRVNRDIFLRSIALVLVTTFFTYASAQAGDIYLAVNTLLMQLFILFSYMMDGFAYAAEALTGRFTGARQTAALKKFIRRIFVWGLLLASGFTILYALFSQQFLYLLTDKAVVIEVAGRFRFWVLLFPVAGFAAFLWDGIYIGLTASRQMRNSMFAAVACFFLSYYLLYPIYGNNGLWFSFVLYLFMRGVMQTVLFPGILRNIH